MIRCYPIVPCPAPRQTRRDTWDPAPRVCRYHAFRDEVRIRHVHVPADFYHVIFVMPMPKSWSARKKAAMSGWPHRVTPDKDNLEKALLDSVFGQDKTIWDGRVTKVWGYLGCIVISDEMIIIDQPLRLPRQLNEFLGVKVAASNTDTQTARTS